MNYSVHTTQATDTGPFFWVPVVYLEHSRTAVHCLLHTKCREYSAQDAACTAGILSQTAGLQGDPKK